MNVDKCLFAVPKLTFLGHVIDENGLTPLDEKAINDFPSPSTLRQLRRFLGMVNYYRQFINNCAIILLRLTSLLYKHKRKNPKITLSADELDSFHRAKQALQDCTKFSYVTSSPDVNLKMMRCQIQSVQCYTKSLTVWKNRYRFSLSNLIRPNGNIVPSPVNCWRFI